MPKNDFCKKVILQGTRFFEVYVQHQYINKAHKKNCALEFLILSALKITSCELVVFIDMTTYILTESRNCETLLKENYAAAFDSSYLFIERGIKHGADSAYGVCIH